MATILLFAVAGPFIHNYGPVDVAYGQAADSGVINLSNDVKYSFNQKIAAANGKVFVAWESQDNSGTQHILFKRSVDGGASFEDTVDLTPSDSYAHGVQMAVVPKNNSVIVYVAWMSLGDDRHDLFLTVSKDGGSSFSTPVNLSTGNPYPFDIVLAAAENNVYVAWRSYPPSQADEIYLRASRDKGTSFDPVLNISQSSGGSQYPTIVAAPGGRAFVAWYDTGTMTFRSTSDGGRTFASAISLSSTTSESWIGPNDSPEVSVSGNNVYVVWQIYGQGIFFRASTDNGHSFGGVVNLSSNPHYPFSPSMSVSRNGSSDIVSIAWYDDAPGRYQVFARTSLDSGSTFADTLNVSNTSTSTAVLPKIVVSNETRNTYSIWKDSGDGLIMKFKQGGSEAYSTPLFVNNRSELFDNYPPSLFFSDGNIYLAWSDRAGGHDDVLFRKYSEAMFQGENSAPVADAGPDQVVDEGNSNVISLNASASIDPDGNILDYDWLQIGGNHIVTLSDPHSSLPRFASPEVYSPGDTLTFQLTVSDGRGASDTDTMQITINDLGEHPLTEEARIAVGPHPAGIAVNKNTNMIYVTTDSLADSSENYNAPPGGAVSVVDGSTYSVVSTITAGYGSLGVAVNENTNTIYVANYGSGATDFPSSISVIDGATRSVTAAIPADSFTYDVAVNPNTNMVYAVNGGTDSVTVLDGSTNAVVKQIAVGDIPARIAVNPATNTIYVSNAGDNSVSIINGNTNEVLTTVALAESPRAIEVNPATDMIYIAGSTSRSLFVINGTNNALSATISVPYSPQEIGVNTLTNTVYVASSSSDGDLLTAVDGSNNDVITSIPAGPSPSAVTLNEASDKLFVTNIGDGTVSAIHLGSTTTEIESEDPVQTNLTIDSWDKSVPWDQPVAISGHLLDADTSEGIGGKVIAFRGTGAIEMASVITNPDGSFNATAISPFNVSYGWTIKALFAGDDNYLPDHSKAIKYKTTVHSTAVILKILPTSTSGSSNSSYAGNTFKVVAVLKDKITNDLLVSKTVSFTADPSLPIPDKQTNSLGKAIAKIIFTEGTGSYEIQAHFGGDSLYAAKDSAIKGIDY